MGSERLVVAFENGVGLQNALRFVRTVLSPLGLGCETTPRTRLCGSPVSQEQGFA